MADGTIKILTELVTDGLKVGLKAATGMIAGAAAALSSLGIAAIKVGVEWESAFAGVKKTVDATDEELKNLSDGLRDLSHEIPMTASGLAEIAEAAGQLGIETDSILGFTEIMANLGVATNMSAIEAASSLAKLANITGMSQKDFDRLGATIVALGNNLATTEADITAMSMRIAGAGAQVGLTEAQMLSFAGALSSVGIEAEAGGTAFSTLISKMSLASAKGGKELEQFAAVAGMSAKDFKKAFEQDAAGAISMFITGLGKINEDGGSAIGTLDAMGLSDIRMRDALLRAAGATDVFTEALEIGTRAWEENTALAKEAAQRYETVESKFQLLKNSANDLGIELYKGVQKPLADLTDEGISMVNRLAKAFKSGGFKALSKEIGTVLADVSTLIADSAPKLVKAATQMIKGLLRGIKDNIPAIVSGAVETVTALIEGLLSMLPDIIDTGIKLLAGLLDGFAKALPDLIPAAVEALVDTIVSAVTNLDTLLEAGANIVMGLLQGIFNAVPKLFEGLGEILRSLFGLVTESEIAIKDSIESIKEASAALTESLAAMNEEVARGNAEIDAACTIAEPWIERLNELEKKSYMTAEEQAEWNLLLGKLKAAIPEVSELINDQTGEIDGGVEALKRYITQWMNYGKAKVYAEMAEEGIRALITAEEELTAADNEYTTAKAEYNNAIAKANALISEMTSKYPELTYWQGTGVQSLYDLTFAINDFGLGLGENEAEIASYQEQIRLLSNTITGLGGDTMNLGLSTDELGGVMLKHKETVAALQQTYDAAQTTVDHYYTKSQEYTRISEEMANSFELSTGRVVKSNDEYIDALNKMYVNTHDATLKSALEFKNLEGDIDDSTKAAVKTILDNFSGLPANLQQSGKDILLGLIGGLDSEIPALEDVSEMSADEIVDTLKTYLGIHSPSTVASDIGGYFMAGLTNGIKSNTGDTVSAMKHVGEQLALGLKKGMQGQESSLVAEARRIADRVTAAFKARLDIHSPSRVMAKEIGAPMMAGIGAGFKDTAPKIIRQMQEAIAFQPGTSSTRRAGMEYALAGVTNNAITNTRNQTINFNQPVSSPAATARALERLERSLAR